MIYHISFGVQPHWVINDNDGDGVGGDGDGGSDASKNYNSLVFVSNVI